MAKIPFTVSARTAKLIGQENFANAEGAIIELVKNAYDADAKTTIIIFDKTEKESSIYIIDNGDGMTKQIVEEKWMQIGTDDKLQNFTSENKRIKTGAKGIGRFALDRLGERARMVSTSKENGQSLCWSVNWNDFEVVGKSINEVKAKLFSLKNVGVKFYFEKHFKNYEAIWKLAEDYDFSTGTAFKVTFLKDNWDEDSLKSLFNNLEVLIPPIEQSEFDIYLFDTRNVDDFGKVNTAYYDDFDYKLSTEYLADENKSLKIRITRNELDIEALETSYKEIFDAEQMKNFPYDLNTFKAKEFTLNLTLNDLKGFSSVDPKLLEKIGKFCFTFYYLKNTISDDKKDGDLKKYPYRNFVSANRKAWLDKFGGVKIFRDGFRVRPYGEKGEDWLKLGERQAKSPQGAGQRLGAFRIRPNQIAGTIKISRIDNPYFNDKSGREGIQENDVFEVFKNLLIEIINLFERDRNIIMFNLSKLAKRKDKEKADREQAKAEAERIQKEKEERENQDNQDNKNNDGENTNTPTEELLAIVNLDLEREIKEKDSEIRLLRGLASVGLIMTSSAHELKSLRYRVVPRTDFLVKELKKYISDESLVGINKDDNPFYMIALMKDDDLQVKHWLDYALNSLKQDKRKRININFGEYFEKFKANWKRSLTQRNVKLTLKGTKDDSNTIQSFEVDLDTIFNNILTNSFEAFTGNQDKEVNISWRKSGDFVEVEFSDNGRGLSPEYKSNPQEIFNALESSKRDRKGNKIGTGLGLYILKSVIDEYNDATVDLIDSKNGLTLKLSFPKRKKQ